ncbi:P1 family peptidase [Microbacterium sp. NPDC087665]|uniref:P1 family peptidase n=1 Tax=Microbacterium sp. NPDC087665 TaxID=3364194 RepID=UPI00381B0A76
MTDTHRLAAVIPAGPRRSNGDYTLTPVHGTDRGQVEYDFPGVLLGTAEYAEGPTGATVLSIPAGARTFTDRRGGAVGASGLYGYNHAICLAGGSVYGLSAVAGVSEALFERADHRSGFDQLQLVSGAIIYDYSVRDNSVFPDTALGKAALGAARAGVVEVGRVGGGAAASSGKVDPARVELTGQGAAFRQVGDVKVLVVTVLNPYGVILDREGRIIRGNYDAATGERRHPARDYEEAIGESRLVESMSGNTTITAVVTNVQLSDVELKQFGLQVHSSMHRGIQPFHTPLDGDTLFALTTDEVALPEDPRTSRGRLSLNSTAVATLAGETAWDAILCAAG